MKRVVIIGGGFAGSHIAKALENDFNVTLIDQKDYFEFTPSILRVLANPKHVAKVEVAHVHYLQRAKVVVGTVTEMSEESVLVDSKTIPFDYAVICSGSSYESPIKDKKLITSIRARQLREYAQKLRSADRVLIIGGGAVGVELAGEIVDAYPQKKITLVHGGSKIIHRNNRRAIKGAEKYLQKKGVHLMYNERVTESKNGIFKTNTGKIIETDMAFLCTGIKPNFSFLKKNFANGLNERSMLRVNTHLQLIHHSNIFAAGDITDRVEEKTAQNAEKQAKTVVKNICALNKNGKLSEYHSKQTPMVISLGKSYGLLVFKNLTWRGKIPALLKWAIEKREMIKKRSV